MNAELRIRPARLEEIPALGGLIAASVRGLQGSHYSPAQMEAALASVYGVDTQLVKDGTYFAVELGERLAACGGWSRRKTLYGGDQAALREDSLLDPATDAARIRAFFVHPDFARRGIGARMLEACESAARAQGFFRFELAGTLPGVAFYEAHGYRGDTIVEIPLGEGLSLPILPMRKELPRP